MCTAIMNELVAYKSQQSPLLLVSLVLTFFLATIYWVLPVTFLGIEIQSWLISKNFGQPDWLPALRGVLTSITSTGTIGDTGLVVREELTRPTVTFATSDPDFSSPVYHQRRFGDRTSNGCLAIRR